MIESVCDSRRWVDVLNFWFKELTPAQWFSSSAELDQSITARFLPTLNTLSSSTQIPPVTGSTLLTCGIADADEVLAAIIVVDQFSRNIYRGSAKAFNNDPLALALSAYLIETGALQAMNEMQIQFAVMPHMHAESMAAQDTCVALFTEYDIEKGLKSAIEHREVIRQFGRFPHRNLILGRESTDAEVAYLENANRFGQ